DVLTADEAHELLASRLGERASAEADAARQLTESCSRLPLALSIVAARAAARPLMPLMELSRELADAQGRLDALDAGDPAASVRAVFSWSCRQLSEPAARLFRLPGLHPGPDLSLGGGEPGRARAPPGPGADRRARGCDPDRRARAGPVRLPRPAARLRRRPGRH